MTGSKSLVAAILHAWPGFRLRFLPTVRRQGTTDINLICAEPAALFASDEPRASWPARRRVNAWKPPAAGKARLGATSRASQRTVFAEHLNGKALMSNCWRRICAREVQRLNACMQRATI